MSENRQIIENPLLLTDLFPKGIYYFGEGQGVSTAQSQLSVNEVEAEKSTVTMPVDEAQKLSESNPLAVVNELQENDENMIALTIIVIRFPSFATMCGNVEMKKHVWQTMKQVLKF